ncbi:hypothetical protein ACQEVB_07385 [Pseudonocardia sp. CA-107938]|uniref:hypothetical protein n=1 Tax=Pseudonocardia sp. CA-107938 TaxID=3240021 RepID=UPI003D932806
MTTSTAPTRTVDDGRLLRLALRVDAAASGALGLVALGAAPLVHELTAAPEAVLRGVGGFLVLFGIALLALAARRQMPVALVWTVVVGNLAWVVASLAVALLVPLTVLGTVLVVAQALAVAAFADLEWMGLRRTTA